MASGWQDDESLFLMQGYTGEEAEFIARYAKESLCSLRDAETRKSRLQITNFMNGNIAALGSENVGFRFLHRLRIQVVLILVLITISGTGRTARP